MNSTDSLKKQKLVDGARQFARPTGDPKLAKLLQEAGDIYDRLTGNRR